MSHSITLSDAVYDRLIQRARRLALSPDAVAEAVLRRELGAAEASWRQEVEAVVARVRDQAGDHPPNVIEADITAAALESRALRRGGSGRLHGMVA